jgi:hypothetical protein
LFSWWENIGLQARFMVIASVGLLTLAIGALAVVDWYEFSSFDEKLKDGVIGRPSLWIAEDFGCCASG